MRYADFVREDMRLVVLRILSELPGYSSNSSLLSTLLAQYGHQLSRDQVKTEIVWLGEQGLLAIEQLESVLMVKLTERGGDVAKGITSVPGVKKPGP